MSRSPISHKRKGSDAFFLRGPIPLQWFKAAHQAGGPATVVGIYLWHLRGMRKTTDSLVVTRKGAYAALGIRERTLRRGLDRLTSVGLITTVRGTGKAIRVNILELKL